MTRIQPISHFVDSLGLKLHVLEWPNISAKHTVLLHHGFLDHAYSWTPVAERLAGQFRVLAIDARGHGDSGWVGAGGYYHFQDYSFDLHSALSQLAPAPVYLVGHSMGGTACGYFAGAFPERVLAYVSIEGLGPPEASFDSAPDRMRLWIDTVAKQQAKSERSFANVAEAAARLKKTNPRLSGDFATFLAEHGTKQAGDGRLRWKFDPLHQSRSPQQFYLQQAIAFWRRIACPVLYVEGEHSPLFGPLGDRVQYFNRCERKTIKNAGHMLHHDQPDTLTDLLLEFLSEHAK